MGFPPTSLPKKNFKGVGGVGEINQTKNAGGPPGSPALLRYTESVYCKGSTAKITLLHTEWLMITAPRCLNRQ